LQYTIDEQPGHAPVSVVNGIVGVQRDGLVVKLDRFGRLARRQLLVACTFIITTGKLDNPAAR
jgi:hypothetical protein